MTQPHTPANESVQPPPRSMDNPRISGVLMTLTYVVGGLGYLIGSSRIGGDGAASAITPVALLSVGIVGVLSMVRHSVFHRSDAVRMGWDLGVRNNFQIETGLANMAIGVAALAAVILDWGTVAMAVATLTYGLYFLGVTILTVVAPDADGVNVKRAVIMATQTALLGYFVIAALEAVPVNPF